MNGGFSPKTHSMTSRRMPQNENCLRLATVGVAVPWPLSKPSMQMQQHGADADLPLQQQQLQLLSRIAASLGHGRAQPGVMPLIPPETALDYC